MVETNVRRDTTGLEDVIRAAARLADQMREVASAAGSVTEREVAMVATIAEDMRDRVFAAERLKVAREDEVLAGFRRSAHRAVDLGFDMAGTVVTAASDAFEAFLKTPRESAAAPKAILTEN